MKESIINIVTLAVVMLVLVGFGWMLRDLADRGDSVIRKAVRPKVKATEPGQEQPKDEKGRWRP